MKKTLGACVIAFLIILQKPLLSALIFKTDSLEYTEKNNALLVIENKCSYFEGVGFVPKIGGCRKCCQLFALPLTAFDSLILRWVCIY